MSLVADAFQPQLLRGVTALEERRNTVALADLIGRQGLVGYDLSFNNQDHEIVADFRDSAALVASMVYDSARFASAAFQTIATVASSVGEKDELAWGLIRVYYAAFYAGHSLIRLLGESCSYFDRSHVAYITTLAGITGCSPSFKLESGVYRCRVNAGASLVACANIRGGKGGHTRASGVYLEVE